MPVVITCHDLLAVRGALGDEPIDPASATGKFLQRWIVRGLEDATAIACDSRATMEDRKDVNAQNGKPALELITLGLSYPYRVLPPGEGLARLTKIDARGGREFVLHVGSNLRRKNREAVFRVFARCREQWKGLLVFAGEPLSPDLRSLASNLE